MPSYADIYILSNERNVKSYTRFLNAFLTKAVESSDEYPVPQYDDEPTLELSSAKEILELSVEDLELEYNLYWHDEKEEFLHASIFLLRDNSVVFGISTPDEDINGVLYYKEKMEKYFPNSLCYIGHEGSEVPDSTQMFISERNKHKAINIDYYEKGGSI